MSGEEKIYFHKMVEDDAPKAGIVELRYIDPRNIRKIREVERQRSNKDDIIKSDWYESHLGIIIETKTDKKVNSHRFISKSLH